MTRVRRNRGPLASMDAPSAEMVRNGTGGRGEQVRVKSQPVRSRRCPTSSSPSSPTRPRPSPDRSSTSWAAAISRLGGRTFPLRHAHLALVLGLLVTAPETDHEHEIRFVLLDPDGGEVAGATGQPDRPRPHRRPRHGADVLDRPLEPDVQRPGRLLVPDPRQRLRAEASAAARGRAGCLTRPVPRRCRRPGGTAGRCATTCRRSTRPALAAARAADLVIGAAREVGADRWVAYFEPLADRLRDDEPRDLRQVGPARPGGVWPEGFDPRRAAGRGHRAVARRRSTA